MHDRNHWTKFHYARLLRTARLLGKLEYIYLDLNLIYIINMIPSVFLVFFVILSQSEALNYNVTHITSNDLEWLQKWAQRTRRGCDSVFSAQQCKRWEACTIGGFDRRQFDHSFG